MRTSQELMLQMSEKRGDLASLTEKLNKAAADGGEPGADDVGQADSLTREIRGLEVRYRAAALAEEEEDRKAADGDPTAEGNKLRDLERRCSVTAFMSEAVTGNEGKGAAVEFRAEVMGKAAAPGFMPIRLLLTGDDERREDRAVTPVADAAKGLGTQAPILPRIFSQTIAAGLGVAMPSVPMGVRTWPVMTGGTTASMQEPSGEQAAVAGSFAGHELGPLRLTGSYEFRVEDLQLLSGLEEALRRDLRMIIADQMDNQVINGDGNAPNVRGFIGGGDVPAGPAAGAAAFGYNDLVTAFTDGVDGHTAYMLSNVSGVIGVDTYKHAETLYRANNTDDSVYDVMSRRAGGLRVTDRLAAGKVQESIFARTSFPGTTAVAPVWDAVQMIRDPYTRAQAGEVRITMLTLWNFKVLRGQAFYRRSLRNAA